MKKYLLVVALLIGFVGIASAQTHRRPVRKHHRHHPVHHRHHAPVHHPHH